MKWRWGKKGQATSLQMVIAGFFTCGMFLLLLFVSVSLVTRLSELLEKNAMERTRQTVDQGNASLGVYVNGMLELMDYFGNLVGSAQDASQATLGRDMAFLQSSRKDVAAMALFSANGELLAGTAESANTSSGQGLPYSWFQQPLRSGTATVFFPRPMCKTSFLASMRGSSR